MKWWNGWLCFRRFVRQSLNWSTYPISVEPLSGIWEKMRDGRSYTLGMCLDLVDQILLKAHSDEATGPTIYFVPLTPTRSRRQWPPHPFLTIDQCPMSPSWDGKFFRTPSWCARGLFSLVVSRSSEVIQTRCLGLKVTSVASPLARVPAIATLGWRRLRVRWQISVNLCVA